MHVKLPKLVRDKISDEIRREGRIPVISVADDDSYSDWLVRKLREELSEFLAARDPVELVDIYEVVRALWALAGRPESLEEAAAAKREARGGFEGRIVLDTIQDGGDCAASPGKMP
jgi:predicted house-cleaning noncanonical NTP pyrophosphatase (MazG superfamily)